jgi:hypothetical protein
MKTLLYSRKFWLAVVGVAQTIIAHYYKVDPAVWQAVDVLIGMLIASIAYEDGKKLDNGSHPENFSEWVSDDKK